MCVFSVCRKQQQKLQHVWSRVGIPIETNQSKFGFSPSDMNIIMNLPYIIHSILLHFILFEVFFQPMEKYKVLSLFAHYNTVTFPETTRMKAYVIEVV